MVKITGTGDDGHKYVVEVTDFGPVEPPPPDPEPAKEPNRVTVGTATHTVDGTNVEREDGMLVVYREPTIDTPTNRWGVEVAVTRDGVVLAQYDRQNTAVDRGPTDVPPGGYVLSGHNSTKGGPQSADWLKANATFSTKPVLSYVDVPVPPKPTPTTGQVIGEYLMDGVGHIDQLSPACNRVLVAFYQGTDLTEWGGDLPAETARALTTWRGTSAPNRVLISLGGQGGTVVLDQVDEGMARINGRFPVDGIDFDNEAYSLSPAEGVKVCRDTAAALKLTPAEFIVQFVPPGGPPVAKAMEVAKAVKAAGFQVYFGQQLYETEITDDVVIACTRSAVEALGEESVLVGIMLGDSHGPSWTPDSAVRRMKQVHALWPKVGVYFWESSRPGTKETATAVAAVLAT